METYNIHQAKTQLSSLIEKAERGEPFIIARAGKPVVRVTAVQSPEPGQERRLGFMKGHIRVPDDFDRMGEREITELFGV